MASKFHMELTTYSPTFQSIFSKLNGRVSSCVTKNKLSLRRHNCLLNSLVHYLINLKQFIFEWHMSWNCPILSLISDSNLAYKYQTAKGNSLHLKEKEWRHNSIISYMVCRYCIQRNIRPRFINFRPFPPRCNCQRANLRLDEIQCLKVSLFKHNVEGVKMVRVENNLVYSS